MKPEKKKVLRIITDISMTVVLICLMAYQVIGEVLHEWGGIFMTVLLIVHHVLNARWYAVLFRGRYNSYRTISTLLNVLLMMSILLTAICGMSMSTHAVPFLYGMLGLTFSRTMHLALSYWSFILMGLHIGLHAGAVLKSHVHEDRTERIITYASMIPAAAGIWLFIRNGIPGYILFREHFAFFDYGKSVLLVFAENVLMLFSFIYMGMLLAMIMKRISERDRK